MNILHSIWYWIAFHWKTRKMNEKQVQQFAVTELTECRDEIYEQYKDEPADRTTIEFFDNMDEVIETFK